MLGLRQAVAKISASSRVSVGWFEIGVEQADRRDQSPHRPLGPLRYCNDGQERLWPIRRAMPKFPPKRRKANAQAANLAAIEGQSQEADDEGMLEDDGPEPQPILDMDERLWDEDAMDGASLGGLLQEFGPALAAPLDPPPEDNDLAAALEGALLPPSGGAEADAAEPVPPLMPPPPVPERAPMRRPGRGVGTVELRYGKITYFASKNAFEAICRAMRRTAHLWEDGRSGSWALGSRPPATTTPTQAIGARWRFVRRSPLERWRGCKSLPLPMARSSWATSAPLMRVSLRSPRRCMDSCE